MSTIEADALPQPADAAPFHPWRRWLARMVDTTLFGTFGIFVVGTLCDMAAPEWYARFAGSMSHGPLAGIYVGMVSFVAAIPIIACLLSLSGTPGKWLCGIKVVRVADGERPTMRESIIREVMVWVRGLGIGFPVVTLILQLLSHADLKDFGETVWDRHLKLRVQYAPMGWPGMLKLAFAILALVTYRLWGAILLLLQ
jgi:uncharacterized RDD family membrane protein YckC